MDVSQERSKEKRNRASCVSRFREFLFISVRAIRLTACFVKGAHWRFFPGSFCQTQMPQCHQRPMKTRELILTSRLRFFDLRTPEQLFAHSNRRLESWLATALLASGAECLLASVRARHPPTAHAPTDFLTSPRTPKMSAIIHSANPSALAAKKASGLVSTRATKQRSGRVTRSRVVSAAGSDGDARVADVKRAVVATLASAAVALPAVRPPIPPPRSRRTAPMPSFPRRTMVVDECSNE